MQPPGGQQGPPPPDQQQPSLPTPQGQDPGTPQGPTYPLPPLSPVPPNLSVNPPLLPLGIQPATGDPNLDGKLVFGRAPGDHYGAPPQVQFINGSGIYLNSDKILGMPGLGIVYELVGYRERFRDNDLMAQRHFAVPWSIRLAWKDWCLGYSQVNTVGTGSGTVNTLSRILPVQHPEMPWLWAVECELVEGMGMMVTRDDIPILDNDGNPIIAGDGLPAFWPMVAYVEGPGNTGPANLEPYSSSVYQFPDGFAHYMVTYKDLDYDLVEDAVLPNADEINRYLTRGFSYAVKSLDLPAVAKQQLLFSANLPTIGFPGGGGFKLANQVIGQGALVIRPIVQLEYTWHDIPNPPWQAIANCVGKVNQFPFDPLGYYQTNIYAYAGQPLGTPPFLPVVIPGAVPGIAPMQLLCHAPKTHRYRTKTGRRTWDIIFRFDGDFHVTPAFVRGATGIIITSPLYDYIPGNGWNDFPAGDGRFYPAWFGGAAANGGLYPTADFSTLFVPSGSGG